MDIDPALRALMKSGSEDTVNVIIGVRAGVRGLQAALDGVGFTVTGSSDFGSEVFLYGRIGAKHLGDLAGLEDIEFISPDTEQGLL